MRRLIVLGIGLVVLIGLVIGFGSGAGANISEYFKEDPDMSTKFKMIKDQIGKEAFMQQRSDAIAMKRGLGGDEPVDPQLRIAAVRQLEQQEREARLRPDGPLGSWTEIGPNPIPNAQVEFGAGSASGRTIAIAIHPTNPDIVYVGTAQGGLYRSTNGGTTWTRLLDNALSLAIGTVAIAPSQPDTIFVGTGEPNFSGDSFFGVGIYRIENASTAAPTVVGPIGGTNFTGRAIGGIAVHPTDPNIIFATSTSGVGGGGVQNNVLADRGIFRSTNALSAAPTFTKLTLPVIAAQTRNVLDVVMDPGNPNLVLCTVVDSFGLGEGGVYRTTNALDPAPTFTRTFVAGTTTTNSRTELALHRSTGGVVTVYAASATAGGTLQRSVDGGATFVQQIDNNFCTAQCFYDIAVAVDPTNADNVYLGGSPTLVFGRSTNGGTTFTADGVNFTAGLHVDTHAIAVAPSNPQIVYFGSDGGIYRTNNVTATPIVWTSLNNATFTATQFQSISVHPTDPNFTIGGTQDNGTNCLGPCGTNVGNTWIRADAGDGGATVIDQNAINTTTVTMYHTYFNQTNAMGFARVLTSATAQDNGWTGLGCGFGGFVPNGMTCAASAILFYAPMEQGPGNPNTLYFGSDVLYRSANSGTTMTKVSQEPIQSGVAISAIGIAPSNDNVRVVGQNNGNLFGTTTGANPLVNLDPTNAIPSNYIGRVAIAPTDANIAYVTLAAFGVPNVWKTTNLNGGPPTWAAAATGLPQVPVNGFVIDPIDPVKVYAGTDIGVYISENAGGTWVPFGTGLPRVAVFDMAITSGRLLRIATHGRGMWEIPLAAPTAAEVSVSGNVFTSEGRGLTNARVTLSGPNGEVWNIVTGRRGNFQFDGIPAGETYVLSVGSRRFQYEPRVLELNDTVTGLEFYPVENKPAARIDSKR